jgi:hypothetical protein
LSALVATVVVAGGAAIARVGRSDRASSPLVSTQAAWGALFSVGAVLLVLSFPVYLVLELSRTLWRTQFLSGIGCSLVLTAAIGLIADRFSNQGAKLTVVLAATAVIAYFGSVAALERGSVQLSLWERHRSAMTQILRVAPSVRPDTVIVLTNVPKRQDPFVHNMWLDMALRLVYPGIRVGGVYFYDDGTPSPGNNIVAEGDQWKWDGAGFPPDLRQANLANTIVVRYDSAEHGGLVTTFPPFLCRTECTTALYHPERLITGPIAPSTVRRYRLPAGF